MLDKLNFGRSECIVRVNDVESGLTRDDLRTVLTAQKLPPTLMLPKVESPEHLSWVKLLKKKFLVLL